MNNILEYLENSAKAFPEKPAFISGKDNLTFGQLNNKAQAIGSFLCSYGIRRPVAVFMQKSPAMISAFFGVAYSGNFYIPLDAEIPAFRIELILKTVDPCLIICDESTQELITTWGLPYEARLYNEIVTHPISDTALANIRKKSVDIDPLYVVFTSGSTGVPKGVVASHKSVIDYTEGLATVLNAGTNSIFGMQSPLYLDACIKEIMMTLKYGATTYIIPPSLFMFPIKLVEYLDTYKINTICWVASALGLIAGLGALDKAIPQKLHTIAFTSEVLPIKHFNKWRGAIPQARFIHLYGPTEATGVSTYHIADRFYEENESIPIGRPFPNTDIVLLDDNKTVPPVSQPGEIHIRGGRLCLGYYGDEAKTAASFIQNPLSSFPDRLYKTGDLGYHDSDGNLFFISRRDHQIKHMGYRIELAEIEYVAARCPDVELACAVFDQEKSRIILYYTTKPAAQDTNLESVSELLPESATDVKQKITTYLKANLPRYMMPYAIILQENLPLTPGGKFDRAGLLNMYIATRTKPTNKEGKQ